MLSGQRPTLHHRALLLLLALAGGCVGEVEDDVPGDLSVVASGDGKIPVDPSRLTVDAVRPAKGNYAALFDEQAAVGDPRAGDSVTPTTQWDNTSWLDADYPMGLVVDLGATYDLSTIVLWDSNNTEPGAVTFQVGSPTTGWTTILSYDCNSYAKWMEFPVTGRTRYLHIMRKKAGLMREVVVYGAQVSTTNQAPVVSAGSGQTITLPTASATLTGTASDPDGSIASKRWSQVSGPATATIGSATSLSTTVSSLVQGTYTFKLTVTDSAGLSASSSTTVTVNPQPTTTGSWKLVRNDATSADYGFFEYLPANYASSSNFPVVIFLHGIGQCGDGNDYLYKVKEQGPPRLIAGGKNYGFVLLAPQSASTWNADAINNYVTWVLAHYKVDPKRVYVTGLSLGGEGTFNFIRKYPSRAAAAVPIATCTTVGNDAQAAVMVSNHLAVWAFHARDDVDPHASYHTATWITSMGKALGATGSVMDSYVSNGSTQTAFYRPATHAFGWVTGQTAFDNGAAPSYPLIFTLYDSGGHGIWDRAYQDDRMWTWMLLQHKP